MIKHIIRGKYRSILYHRKGKLCTPASREIVSHAGSSQHPELVDQKIFQAVKKRSWAVLLPYPVVSHLRDVGICT